MMLKTRPCISFGFFEKISFAKFEQLNSDSSLSAGVSGTVSSAMNQAGTNAALSISGPFFTQSFLIPLFKTNFRYFLNRKFVIQTLLICRITSK